MSSIARVEFVGYVQPPEQRAPDGGEPRLHAKDGYVFALEHGGVQVERVVDGVRHASWYGPSLIRRVVFEPAVLETPEQAPKGKAAK